MVWWLWTSTKFINIFSLSKFGSVREPKAASTVKSYIDNSITIFVYAREICWEGSKNMKFIRVRLVRGSESIGIAPSSQSEKLENSFFLFLLFLSLVFVLSYEKWGYDENTPTTWMGKLVQNSTKLERREKKVCFHRLKVNSITTTLKVSMTTKCANWERTERKEKKEKLQRGWGKGFWKCFVAQQLRLWQHCMMLCCIVR